MKRWHQDLTIARREWRKHRRMHVESNKTRVREVGQDPYEVDCPCDDQIGRFRKWIEIGRIAGFCSLCRWQRL